MPTYVFRCKCGHEKEIEAEFGKSEAMRCPFCLYIRRMQKVLYHPPVQFFGLGFTKSWESRDIENTYSNPPVDAEIEHQMNWEEDKIRRELNLKKRTAEMWERLKPNRKMSLRVWLFELLFKKA